MRDWTPDASERLELYMGRVRATVAGAPAVDPDEVLQDIRSHVDAELASSSDPVTVGALDVVLERLGSPAQWGVAPETLSKVSPARRLKEAAALWQARLAGEWGTPVLLTVLAVVGALSFDFGGFLLLGLVYFIGRGMLMQAPPTLVGFRRLLVWSPVALVAAMVAGVVVTVPVLSGFVRVPRELQLVGLWWMLLGFASSREPGRVRWALYPLANWFEPSHGRLLLLLGTGLTLTWLLL